MDGGTAVRTAVGAVAVAGASAVVLGTAWVAFAVPLALLVDLGLAALVATGVTLLAGAAGGAFAYSGGRPTVRVAGYLAAIGAATGAFLATVFFVTTVVLFVVEFVLVDVLGGLAIPAGAAVTLALACGCVLGVLGAFRAMDEQGSWALTLRMYLALVVMALCAVCFFVATWAATFLLSLLVVSPSVGFATAGAVTAAGMALAGYLEYRQVFAVEERADASPVTAEAHPDLHARTTRIAAQLDVPVPAVAVAERAAPEAMVVGVRPTHAHLVVSTGLLDALDGDQLDAVIAHELAHVANRDATVMTVVSAPVVVAHAVLSRLYGDAPGNPIAPADDSAGDHTDLTEEELYGEDGEWYVGPGDPDGTDSDGDRNWLALLFKPVPLLVWAVGLPVVAMLSRTRETVADRTAAEVTGTPATLASALRTIDDRIEAVPERDLRAAAGVSALSIVPLDSGGVLPSDDESGNSEAAESSPGVVRRVKRRLFATHPATETRLDRLHGLGGEE